MECEKKPSVVEKYVNDRIGFREFLITAYQYIDLIAFHELNHPSYQMGKDGWIYTREWDAIDYQHLDANEEYIEKMSDFLLNIQRYCEKSDADFCFFLVPNKESMMQDIGICTEHL